MISIKLFISYSSLDKDKVAIITKLLANDNRFEPVVIATYREALKPLAKKVIDGIANSDIVIPILTQNSISTQWINQEIGFATASNKTIIPIVEATIVNDLKGFIHKQIDLPYTFEYHPRKSVTNRNFKSTLITLLNDIHIESKIEENISGKEKHTKEFNESLLAVDKLNAEIQFNKKRDAFLHSPDGANAAKEEVLSLFTDLKSKIETIKQKNIIFGHEEDLNTFTIIYKSHNYSFSINWGIYNTSTTENSVLTVRFWLGYVTSDKNGYFHPSDRLGLAEGHIYYFTVIKPWKYIWQEKNTKSLISSSEIVSKCISWIIKKIESAELGR